MSERSLPQAWAFADFQDAFKIGSDGGKRIPESDYLAEGALPVIDQGEKPIGGYCNDEALKFDGDLPVILFGDHTRRVKLVHHPFVVGAQGIKILQPKPGFDPRFLYYQFSTIDLPDKGYSRHFQYLRKAQFVAAPSEEQGRIVAEIEKQFTRLDAATAALKRVQANLKRYRASVLKAACEGRLVPTEAELARKEGRDYEPADKLLQRILRERRSRWEADTFAKMQASGKPPSDDRWKQKYREPSAPDTSNLPPLPEGWCWASLEQLTSLITSGSRGWGDSYAEVGPLFIRAQDIKTDSLKLDSIARVELPSDSEGTRTRVYKDDLLVTITGANVTKAAHVTFEIEEAFVSQHVGLVRPVMPETAVYIYSWIISPSQGRRELLRLAYGAGKPGLNLENLRTLVVAMPPVEEQARLENETERLLSTAITVESSIQRQVDKSTRIRSGILQQAFTGQLVPQDPTDEPASALLERIRAERVESSKKTIARKAAREREQQ
jgi:type I restriction enzyme S subunit